MLDDCPAFIAPEILDLNYVHHFFVVACLHDQVGLYTRSKLLDCLLSVDLEALVLVEVVEFERSASLEHLRVKRVAHHAEVEHCDDEDPDLPFHVERVEDSTEYVHNLSDFCHQRGDVDVLERVLYQLLVHRALVLGHFDATQWRGCVALHALVRVEVLAVRGELRCLEARPA